MTPQKSRLRLQTGEDVPYASVENKSAYAGRELMIFRVGAGPDDKIYGSSILPEYLLCYDPAQEKTTTVGLIPGAEAYALLSTQNRLYIASYPEATLQIYDPTKPFHPGTHRTDNPAYYGEVAPHQDRPYDMTVGTDGRIYIACVPAYGYHGGALAWYDPKTDKVGYVPTPIPDQAIASLSPLPDGLLACGTSTEGGPGTTPIAKEAVLFLWDTATQQQTFSCAPVPGAASISNLATGGDGLIYGTAGKVFVFDPKSHAVLTSALLKEGAVIGAGLLTLNDGRVIALTKSSALFLRYANGRLQTQVFAQSQTPFTAGKAILGNQLYAATDKALVRVSIP